jgi:hypothetical protein
MSEQDSRAQHSGRDLIRAEIDVPPTPPDPNRPLPIPKTPPAPPTPTDEPLLSSSDHCTACARV